MGADAQLVKPWDGVGEAYAASYAELCAGTAVALVEGLGEARGGRLLDVGSGTGALASILSVAGWGTTGCEPEATMRVVSAREHPEIPVVAGGLPDLPFERARFDAVVANFVLNHVADPRMSAAEMARVAVPGGVLAATCWTRSPSWFWSEVCAVAGIAPPAGARLPEDKDFERTAGGFGRMLAEAGWRDLEVRELTWTWSPSPQALWCSAEGGVASAGAFYLALDDGDRSRFREAFDEVCLARGAGGGVPLEHSAALAFATRCRTSDAPLGGAVTASAAP